MVNKVYNCSECKYINENINDMWICTKSNKEAPDNGCNEFDMLRFCDTCKYAKILVYETGTIDCIDYRCMLQNNRLVYSDINPMRTKNAEYPSCILDMYEESEKQER